MKNADALLMQLRQRDGFISFAVAKPGAKNCVKGWICGNTCLSRTKKNCKKPIEGQPADLQQWLEQKFRQDLKGVGTAKSQPTDPQDKFKAQSEPKPATTGKSIPLTAKALREQELKSAGQAKKDRKTPFKGKTPSKTTAVTRPPERSAEATTSGKSNPLTAKALRDRIAAGENAKDLVFQYAKQNYTAPKSQLKHGMSKPENMWSFEFEGIRIHDSGDFNPDAKALKLIERLAKRQPMPTSFLRHTRDIYYCDQPNKEDSYWATKYNKPNFSSGATGGDGSMVNYKGTTGSPLLLMHEGGHNLAGGRYGTTIPPENSDYAKAMKTAPPVTSYASVAPAEDFAEAVQMFLEDPESLKMKALDRYNVIERMLRDENYGG